MDANRHMTAKAKCTRHEQVSDDQILLEFQADYDDGRNKEWAKYTPAFSTTMTVLSEVAEQFEQGDKITVTFSKSED
jgi:hypothetical protein